jgi:exoribonuclease R
VDRLSVAEPMAGVAVKVFVAAADVDALVKRRSAIDDHAQTNTTSVYTAAAIFPMLPERLSTDLTSLGEGRERLAIVIEMVVAPDGTVKQSDVYPAAVGNRAKLAYNSVAAWLKGIGASAAAGCHGGRARRERRGACEVSGEASRRRPRAGAPGATGEIFPHALREQRKSCARARRSR